jgi:voltage-gated potassium channel Kch
MGLYFSIVTITTLGYGDISPLTTEARMIATAEAFVGQMYVAVTIARLVGIYTSKSLLKKED